jgi:opacity protein-like surface antigen
LFQINLYALQYGILTQDANFRESADIDSKIIAVELQGKKIEVLQKVYTQDKGTWYKTNYGFVSIDLVNTNFANSELYILKPNEKYGLLNDKKLSFKNTKGINYQNVIVYEKPDFNSNIVSKHNSNFTFTVLETEHNTGDTYPWYKVDGGWINLPYLYKNPSIKKTKTTPMPKEKVVVKELVKKKEPIIKKVQKKKSIIVQNKPSKKAKKETKTFLGVALGLSKQKVTQNDRVGGFPILSNQPDESGYNILVEYGYRYNDNDFSTISFMNTHYNDIKLYNLLISHNFSYQYENINPYIGIVGGFSFIELTRSHINSTLPDEKGREFTLGFQAGAEYTYDKNIVLFGQYQYLKLEHKTNLYSGTAISEFQRDKHQNINFGIRWKFSLDK